MVDHDFKNLGSDVATNTARSRHLTRTVLYESELYLRYVNECLRENKQEISQHGFPSQGAVPEAAYIRPVLVLMLA